MISVSVVIRLGALRPQEFVRILKITDSLDIHREAVIVPLVTEEKGSITLLPDGHLRIVCPSNVGFDEWLRDLPLDWRRWIYRNWPSGRESHGA